MVAVQGGDNETAVAVIREMRSTRDDELPLALARHAVVIQDGAYDAREASAAHVTWAARQGPDTATTCRRLAVVLAGLQVLAPGSRDVALSLDMIAMFYRHEGADLDRALEYYQRGWAIRQRLAPDSGDVVGSLNNTGDVYSAKHDRSRARDCYQRALAIQERIDPDSPVTQMFLNDIGHAYYGSGDLDHALEYYQRSLALVERLGPLTCPRCEDHWLC